ncbi:MAG: adenylate cyclase [Hyphomicrobiaceae bacterium]|jgi:adenylate cyclase
MSKTSKIRATTHEALLGKPELTALELQSLSGIPVEQAAALWQALGFPRVPIDDEIFCKSDVKALHSAARLFNDHQVEPEVLTQMARATGQALARVAHMHTLSVKDEIEAAVRSDELSENQAADRVAELAESLVRGHESFLTYIWRRHLLAAVSQTVASASANEGNQPLTVVGFADLVDFTAVSRKLTEEELCTMVNRFEAIAYQEIPDRGGRIIKTLGDEVMFSSDDPRAASETALALAEACHRDAIVPDVRVGMAIGSALSWEGDLYGDTVNLASRLVGVARPGTAIVSGELAALLGKEFEITALELRKVHLKGIGKTRPWVLRRTEVE